MSDLNLTDALKMAMWLPADADARLVEAPSIETQADDALREAHSVSNLNATMGELYGILRWYRSPAARVLGVLDGTSSSVRARRLNESEAWGIAMRLFAADGATRAEIDGIERQCDLDRVLVLPLRHGSKPARYRRPERSRPDDLGAALIWRQLQIRRAPSASGIIRSTHREVHAELVGETYDQRLERMRCKALGLPVDSTAEQMPNALGMVCKWCAEGGR